MKKIVIFCAAVLFTSCSLYKPYTRPTLDIMADTGVEKSETEAASCFDTLYWRQLFTDPLLQNLIDSALQYNADLNIARQKVLETEALLKTARLAYIPSLSLGAEGCFTRGQGAVERSLSVSGNAAWELDIFGKSTAEKRAAKENHQGAQAYTKAVQTSLIAGVAGSYYTLSALDEQLSLQEETLQTWLETERVLEALKQSGHADEPALLQAKANRMALQADLFTTRKQIQQTENALCTLIGIPLQSLERTLLSEQNFPENLAWQIPLSALMNRPDVQQAEHNLATAFYATEAARASFYPSLNISGSIGLTTVAGSIVVNPAAWLFTAIGSLMQPLFENGRLTAQLKIAQAQQEEAKISFRQVLLEAAEEVANAQMSWQTASSRLQIDRERKETLEQAVRKTELLMMHSSLNYLQVLTARQDLLTARQTLIEDRLEKIQSVITLYHALGGGV